MVEPRVLPLPTTVRWAIDRPDPSDPQRRALLVLFYDGNAQGWRVVDAGGVEVFRVPIAGSGVFAGQTCAVTARRPNEGTTWIRLNSAVLDRFEEHYRGPHRLRQSCDGRFRLSADVAAQLSAGR